MGCEHWSVSDTFIGRIRRHWQAFKCWKRGIGELFRGPDLFFLDIIVILWDSPLIRRELRLY